MQRAAVHRGNGRGDFVDDGFTFYVQSVLGLSNRGLSCSSELALTLFPSECPEKCAAKRERPGIEPWQTCDTRPYFIRFNKPATFAV